MRNLGLAAALAVALTPEAALGPSFQMSFAAVLAIVAWYEQRRERDRAPGAGSIRGHLQRHGLGPLAAIATTTVLASVAVSSRDSR